MNKFYSILLILFIWLGTSLAQEVHVFATTDTTEYIVGDYIDYSLELKYPKGINVVIPMVKDSIDNLVFIKNGKTVHEENGNEVYEQRHFIFSKYDSSDVTIPSFYIPYTFDGGKPQFAFVNSVDIVVRTIEVDSKAEIQDIKAPKRIPLNWVLIIAIVLLILALVIGGFFGYKYYKKKHGTEEISKPKIIIPPHKVALKRLHELEEKKLWQQGAVKEYHSELTGIIRDYFEERFGFNSLEMTTKETVENLKDSGVSTEVIVTTEKFLDNADMVKFAKFEPMPTVNEAMLQEAYDIIDSTKVETELEIG